MRVNLPSPYRCPAVERSGETSRTRPDRMLRLKVADALITRASRSRHTDGNNDKGSPLRQSCENGGHGDRPAAAHLSRTRGNTGREVCPVSAPLNDTNRRSAPSPPRGPSTARQCRAREHSPHPSTANTQLSEVNPWVPLTPVPASLVAARPVIGPVVPFTSPATSAVRRNVKCFPSRRQGVAADGVRKSVVIQCPTRKTTVVCRSCGH